MSNSNINISICYCSYMSRSIVTFNQVAEELNLHHIPIIKTYRLNPRHLGAFQGMEY
jgi:2,3-bisphosphoglycerate-dependent phosphoglycerate mutase